MKFYLLHRGHLSEPFLDVCAFRRIFDTPDDVSHHVKLSGQWECRLDLVIPLTWSRGRRNF